MSVNPRDLRSFSSEIKFLVDPALAPRIRDWARLHLTSDPNGGGPYSDEYRITSLYLDTSQYDVFHRRGSYGNAKYRVRRYGEASTIFLERKLKRRGFLHKRRTAIELDTLDWLDLSAPVTHDWRGYWFHRRLMARQLRPVCEVTYLRTARLGLTDGGPVRVTLDEAVQALSSTDLRFAMAPGLTVERQCVLEMKFVDSPPVLLKQMIEQFTLQPKPISKYRLSVQALGLAEPRAAANA